MSKLSKVPGLYFPSEGKRYLGLLATDEAKREQARAHDAEIADKLMQLIEHYGITPGPTQFYELSLALARDMYPEPKKRGRKTKWGKFEKGVLVVEVERLVRRNDPARGIEWACQILAKREPWASFVEIKDEGIPNRADALKQIYFDFRADKWAKVTHEAFEYYKAVEGLDAWQSQYVDAVGCEEG